MLINMSTSASRTPAILAAVAGAALLGAALVVALASVTAGSVDCGSVISPASTNVGGIWESAFAEVGCGRELAPRRGWAIFLLIVGLLSLTVGLVLLGRRNGSSSSDNAPTPSPNKTTSPVSSVHRPISTEIAELARLRDAGVLTPEEFLAAKKRLITPDSGS